MKTLKTVLLLFAASRLLIFLCLSIGQPEHVQYADNQLQLNNPIVDRFIFYDSYNFAQMASEGYSEDRLTVFFPLFPLLVKGFAVISGIDVYWAGFVLSNFFFACSLWLFYRLMEKRGLSERIKILTLSILAFFPSSYFFSAFYTESFFLFLALLAFRLWGDDKRGAAYFIGGLAALTRIVGVWIPLAFFLERLIRRKSDFKDFTWALISGFMFSVYPVYLWLTKGDPLLFLKVQPTFFGRHSTIPFFPIFQDLLTFIKQMRDNGQIQLIIVFHLILFLIFLHYLISAIRRHRQGEAINWSEIIYTFGLILMPLCSSLIQPINISSHGFMRYFLTVFPLFLFLGKQSDQVLQRADKKSLSSYFIVWKLFIYLTLFMWVIFSVYNLMYLRQKGFIA